MEGKNAQIIERLTGSQSSEDLRIFAEDKLSESLLSYICHEEKCFPRVSISTFGAAENCFTIASAMFLVKPDKMESILLVLDGDRYVSDDEKMNRIKSHLTGTEECRRDDRNKVMDAIKQFVLPPNTTSPEKYYIWEVIMKQDDNVFSEISPQARNLLQEFRRGDYEVADYHKLLDDPISRLNFSKEMGYSYFVELLSKTSKWLGITEQIRGAIKQRLGLTEGQTCLE